MTDAAWYRRDPAALESAVQDALVIQPHMRLDDEGHRVVLRGRFEILADNELLEAFAVDVVLPDGSPRGLPSVWETGGRIPRQEPHHVNSTDDSLCVLLPEVFWYEHPDGLSLAEYLDGPLRRHLAGQAMVLRGEPWPAGEWGHGARGICQFYQEIFDAKNPAQLNAFFDLLTRDRVKGHWPCPCESGLKLRQCHGEQVHRVRDRIPSALLEPVRKYAKLMNLRGRDSARRASPAQPRTQSVTRTRRGQP